MLELSNTSFFFAVRFSWFVELLVVVWHYRAHRHHWIPYLSFEHTYLWLTAYQTPVPGLYVRKMVLFIITMNAVQIPINVVFRHPLQ